MSIRFLAQVEGSLAAMRYANRHAQLFTKMMNIEKTMALKYRRGNFDASMYLTDDIYFELDEWLENRLSFSAHCTHNS